MTNKIISDLNELTTVSNSDVLLVETNTETSKVTKENLLKEVNEQLINKSNVSHTHDEYVTDSELDAKRLATKDELNSKVSYDDFNVVTGATWFKGAENNWAGTKHRFLNYRFEKDKFALNDGDIAVFKMKIRCKNIQHLNAIEGLRLWHNMSGGPVFSASYTQINQQTREYTIQVTIANSQETYYQCDLAIVVNEDYCEDIEGYVFDVTVENKTTSEIFYDAVLTVSETSTLKHNQEFTMIELSGYATETFVTNKIAEAQLGGTGGSADLSRYVTYDDLNVVTGATWFKGADGNFSGVWHKYLVYKFEKDKFALNDGDIAVFKMKIRCKNIQHLNAIEGLRLWHNKTGAPVYSASYTQINQQTREYTIQVTINSSQETYYQCDLAMVFNGDYHEGIEGYVFDVTVENKTTDKTLYNVVPTNEETSTLKHNQEFTMIELSGYATETFVTNKIAEAQLGGTGGSADLSRYVTYDDLNVVTGATWFKGADGNWSGIWHKYLVYKFEKSEFALNNGNIAVFKMKIRCKSPQDLNIIEGLRLWHNKTGAPVYSASYTQINQQTREYTIQVTIADSQETYYQCDLAIAFNGDYYEDIEGYVFDVTVENKTTDKTLYNVVPTNEETSTLKHNQDFTMLGVRMDDIKITSNDLEESYIPSVKNKKIICAGDSLTNGYNGANSSYVQHVQNFYPDCTVLNKGSNGGGTDRLVNILTDMARDNANTYPIENPDYSDCIAVIINIGTNGGVSGNKNTSIPQLVEKTVADIPFQYNDQTIDSVTKYWSLFSNDWWGNMGLIIEYIKWKNPKTQIFLTPPAVNRISDTESSSPFKIREAMLELGEMYGLTVIDVIQGLGINKRNNHLFRVDYCHGNDLRNEMVGKYIAKQIYSHIYDF